MMAETLLEIRDLHLEFSTFEGVAKVLTGVNLQLRRGEFLGLVGETGCGKSMTALSIPRLIPMPPGRITGGEVIFEGEDLLQYSGKEIETFRATKLGVVFQDPVTNLNPMFSIREQIIDAVIYQSEPGKRNGLRKRKSIPQWATEAAGCARTRGRIVAAGRHPGSGTAHPRIPAPIQRRDAPARAHRYGSCRRAAVAHCR